MKKAKGEESEQLKLWNALCTTPPEFTKGFKRTGGFEGTSINPTYAVRKLTEMFGPEGFGWGREEVAREMIPVPSSGELLIYISIRLWYMYDEKQCFVGPQWGGDRIVTQRRDQSLVADDEAFKKASTDGFLKCASFLGIGGDIHLGCYDDSKYINSIKTEGTEARTPSTPPVVLDERVKRMNENWQQIRVLWKSQGMEEREVKVNAERWLKIWDEKLRETSADFSREERQDFIIERQMQLIADIRDSISD